MENKRDKQGGGGGEGGARGATGTQHYLVFEFVIVLGVLCSDKVLNSKWPVWSCH